MKSMRSKKYFALLLLGGLAMSFSCKWSCDKSDPAISHGNDGSSAAMINGVSITASELDNLHQRAVERFKKTGRPVSEKLERDLRGSILRKMIDDEIIHQKALEEAVKVDRFERVEALERYKARIGGEKSFQMFLERQELTEDQVLETVLAEVQRDKLIKKVGKINDPSEAEIKQHYQANLKLYTLPEMVRARHILLKLSPREPKEKAALVQKKAQTILKEAQAPNASFAALAQKYSEGPSGKKGGDLGFFPRGRMVKNFEDAAFNAPLKKVIGPVQTDFGLHLIYVEEKSPSKEAPLAEVRDRIVDFLKRNQLSRKSEELLAAWRKSADIKIYDGSMTKEEYISRSTNTAVANKN